MQSQLWIVLRKKRIHATSQLNEVKRSKYIIICIGTPITRKLNPSLKNFVKKNKLSNSVFKDLSTIKNLSKINSKTTFSTNFGRDIEYYTGIVFEIYNSSKKEIARGGRYDGLLKSLGSKKNISAVGAAINLNNIQT